MAYCCEMEGFGMMESEYQTRGPAVKKIEFMDSSRFIAHNEKEIKLFQITQDQVRLSPLLHISNMHRFHLHSLSLGRVNGVTLTADEITCNVWSLEDPQAYR